MVQHTGRRGRRARPAKETKGRSGQAQVKGQKLPQSESRRPGFQSRPPPPQIWGEVPRWARRPGPPCGGPHKSHKGRAEGSLTGLACGGPGLVCGGPGPDPASVPPALGLGKGRAEGSPAAATLTGLACGGPGLAAALLTGLACGGPGLACIFKGSIITRRPGLACIFNGSIINRSIIATRVEGPGQPQ